MSSVSIVLLVILIMLAALWALGAWFRRAEDLTVYDHPAEPAAWERFGDPGGPSPEHRAAADIIGEQARQAHGMSRRQMLRFMRDLMEQLPADKTFDCEFRPADAGGVPGEWVLAANSVPARRVLYLHGGAFTAGSPNSHRAITSRFAEVARAAVLAVDYRLLPENRRIDGIRDCQAAYRWILENGPEGTGSPERLFMGGDSAGGNLSLVLSWWARDTGLRAADAIVAMSPLTDSTYSSPTLKSNLPTDTMLGPLFGVLTRIPGPLLGWMYVIENHIKPSNPLVSPVFADLTGLPPTLLHASEAEMLFGDAQRYVNKARAAGSPVRLQSWAGLMHVWQLFYPEVPEAREAWDRIEAFLQQTEAAAG